MPEQTVSFGLSNIQALADRGHTRVSLPSGHTVTLHRTQLTPQPGGYWLRAKSDGGLTSTFTVRNGRFMATVATRNGVFRLQQLGGTQHTQVVAHQTLDNRTLEQEKDFKYVPQ